MTADELRGIIANGQNLLNVDLSDLMDNIILYSVGVPAVTHQLALNACVSRGVDAIQAEIIRFDGADFDHAVQMWLDDFSDSLKATFDRALMRHRVRQFDNCRLILTALAAGPLTGMLHAEILEAIRAHTPTYPAANLTQYLAELATEERGEVITKAPDGRYRFTDPLHHTYAKASLLQPAALVSRESLYAQWLTTMDYVVTDFNAVTKWVDLNISPSIYYTYDDLMPGTNEEPRIRGPAHQTSSARR